MLYKRSSINHSSTTVIVSVPFSIIPLLLSLYLSHSASFLYCCHCICPIQCYSSTTINVSVPLSIIPLLLSLYLSHSVLFCCHCHHICPMTAAIILSGPLASFLCCCHIYPISQPLSLYLSHSASFLHHCHHICPIFVPLGFILYCHCHCHCPTGFYPLLPLSLPLSHWVLSFTAIVIATVPLGFILYCHCRCCCPTWLYLLLPLLLPLSHWVLSFTAIVVTSVPLSIISPPLSAYVPFSVILYRHCHLPCCFQVKEGGKLQALVYNILPPATAITGYSIGLEKLSADCFCWCSDSSMFVTNKLYLAILL